MDAKTLPLLLSLLTLAGCGGSSGEPAGGALWTLPEQEAASPPSGVLASPPSGVLRQVDVALAGETLRLLDEAARPVAVTAAYDKRKKGLPERVGPVRVRATDLEGGPLELLVEFQTSDGGRSVFRGKVPGEDGSSVHLVKSAGRLVGDIQRGDGTLLQLRQLGERSVLREMDPNDGVDGEPLVPPGPLPPPRPDASDDGSSAVGRARIDVLVVFTSAAQEAAEGSGVTIGELVQLAESETNQGLASSGLPHRVRVVAHEKVEYREGNLEPLRIALEHVTFRSDGKLDGVHRRRRELGADMVSLWIDAKTSIRGRAWVQPDRWPGFEAYAFSAVQVRFATSPSLSFGHELGHNWGARHDRGNAGAPGLDAHCYGYQDPSGDFRSLMAYPCPTGDCRRLNRWSSYQHTHQDRPLGKPPGAPDAAHNVGCLAVSMPVAATWSSRLHQPAIGADSLQQSADR